MPELTPDDTILRRCPRCGEPLFAKTPSDDLKVFGDITARPGAPTDGEGSEEKSESKLAITCGHCGDTTNWTLQVRSGDANADMEAS